MMPLKFECYCASLRQAARAISQKYDAALRDTGLTITQFTLLNMISQMPLPRVNDLADALAMDQTSLSRTLRTMERDGLVAEVAGEDKRESRWALGPQGQKRFKKAFPVWQATQKSIEKILGPDARRISAAAHDLSTRLSN